MGAKACLSQAKCEAWLKVAGNRAFSYKESSCSRCNRVVKRVDLRTRRQGLVHSKNPADYTVTA